MANPNPTHARRALAQKRLSTLKAAGIQDARMALSLAMHELTCRIDQELTNDEACRLANAVARTAAELRAMVEASEFEARLVDLERQYAATERREI